MIRATLILMLTFVAHGGKSKWYDCFPFVGLHAPKEPLGSDTNSTPDSTPILNPLSPNNQTKDRRLLSPVQQGIVKLMRAVSSPCATMQPNANVSIHRSETFHQNAAHWNNSHTLSIIQSLEFTQRKTQIKCEMQNKTKDEFHPNHESALLVLDARYTIFDSTQSNTLLMRMLEDQSVLFFNSQSYNDVIHVIRPGIIRLIHQLLLLSNANKLYTVIYIKTQTRNETELDAIVSVMAFIEMYFKYRCGSHQNIIPFQFDYVLMDDSQSTDCKNTGALVQKIPVATFNKMMIVDYDGLNVWRFSRAWDDVLARECPAFKKMVKQIIPIQPSPFILDDGHTVQELRKMCKDEFFDHVLKRLQKAQNWNDVDFTDVADFTRHWFGQQRVTIDSTSGYPDTATSDVTGTGGEQMYSNIPRALSVTLDSVLSDSTD
eukprot:267249_1